MMWAGLGIFAASLLASIAMDLRWDVKNPVAYWVCGQAGGVGNFLAVAGYYS